MRFEDVKIGMKVVPFKKSSGQRRTEGADFNHYMKTYFSTNEGVLFVTEINESKRDIGLWRHVNTQDRDWFKAEDFELYVEPHVEPKQIQPKKETKKMTEKEKVIRAKRERGKKIKAMRDELGIERIIVNGKTMVVFFKSGEKVVEKAVGKDEMSIEIGIALAMMHKMATSKSIYHEMIESIGNKIEKH